MIAFLILRETVCDLQVGQPTQFIYTKYQPQPMGACTQRNSSIQRRKEVRCDVEPSDTQSFKQVTLPNLTFYVLLSDIKIKKCEIDSIGLRFRINGIEEYSCPQKQLDNQRKAYWHINHSFEFAMTQYQLRKKFLIVEAVNRRKEVIGTLIFNIYTIWIGPYHIDFLMDLKGSSTCRISFNFRISQGLFLKLENTYTEMIPIQPKVEGTRFTFTMEAIIGQKTQPSNYAYNICVDQSQASNKGVLGNFPKAKCVKKDHISWQQLPNQTELPRFNDMIAYYEIYSSSLHFNFWKIVQDITDMSEQRYQSQGQSFISISKLMASDYTITKDSESNISYLKRQIQLTQKVWLHGKEVGTARMKFNFLMQAHQKQMQSCVRTEEGILTSTPIFTITHAEECQQITALNKLNTNIQKQFINLDDTVEQSHNYVMLKEIVKRLYTLLDRQLGLLSKTYKESILFYNYQNQMELMKGQRFLIDFAFKVISYIHEDIADLNDICWQILTTILKRGEFKLSHMAFTKEEKEALTSKKMDKALEIKTEIALKYMELLNQLLKQTLRCLEIKGQTAQQVFAEKFCAYAYFRLPSFREHILEAIREGNDPEIPEWRGTEINLYQEGSTQDFNKNDGFYENLFDWEHNFIKPLAILEKFKHITFALQNTLLEDRWKLRLSHRRGAFFTFMENLVSEIEYVSVVSKYIKWYYLPGYTRLLHAFLFQMKNNKIKNYSQRFKKCCYKLLSNEKLLNVFIVLLLKKSNVNDPETVSLAFQMMDEFFKVLKSKLRPIPGTFDYKFLLLGIKTVLESEFQMSISQVLLFIFDNFKSFSQEFTLELCIYLLNKMFYRFFFHWSFNLREVFHMLIYVKIGRFDVVRKDASSPGRGRELAPSGYISGLKLALRQRYDTLLETIKNDIEPHAPKSNIDVYLDKEYYQKMKSKLTKKRYRVKMIPKEDEAFLSPLHSSKSLGENTRYITPKKLLFFKDEETQLIDITPDQMGYVKLALSEYNEIIETMKPLLDQDPTYCPPLQIKKLLDEAQLDQENTEEW